VNLPHISSPASPFALRPLHSWTFSLRRECPDANPTKPASAIRSTFTRQSEFYTRPTTSPLTAAPFGIKTSRFRSRWANVVETIFEKTFIDGNADNELHGLQTMSIALGEGAMVEFTLQQPSKYPFLTHSFGDADLGAIGAFVAK
jgi:hypothetical protein